MSLYPTTVLNPDDLLPDQPNIIPSGNLFIIPIDMTTMNMTEIMLSHMGALVQSKYLIGDLEGSPGQDFSLRAWISRFQGGTAIISPAFPTPNGIYPILKWNGLPIVIYLPGQTPPENTYSIPVPTPAVYWLNLLNLTNERSYFGFSMTDLD